MITVSNVSLNFSGEPLFKDVNVKIHGGELLWCHRCEWCRKIYIPENFVW